MKTELLTTKDLATLLGCHVAAVNTAIRRGDLKAEFNAGKNLIPWPQSWRPQQRAGKGSKGSSTRKGKRTWRLPWDSTIQAEFGKDERGVIADLCGLLLRDAGQPDETSAPLLVVQCRSEGFLGVLGRYQEVERTWTPTGTVWDLSQHPEFCSGGQRVIARVAQLITRDVGRLQDGQHPAVALIWTGAAYQGELGWVEGDRWCPIEM